MNNLLFDEILEDSVLTRAEKKLLTQEIASHQLNQREQLLLLSKIRDALICKREESKEAIELFYNITKSFMRGIHQNQEKSVKEQVLFSPGEECRQAICSAIRFAEKTMDICVFTISDNQITDEILKAHKRRKSIRIITDNDKTQDLGSDIELLQEAGVEITTDHTNAHMHHKFAVFDQSKLITGSYNWTRSAAERNYENLIISTNQKLIFQFTREFENLWNDLN